MSFTPAAVQDAHALVQIKLFESDDFVKNGGMELDSDWLFTWSGTQVRSDEQAHSGTYSRKWTANASGVSGGTRQFITGLTIGKTYKIIAWFRGLDLVSGNFRLGLGGTTIIAPVSNGTWIKGEVTYQATAESTTLYLVVHPAYEANANKSFYGDDVSIKELLYGDEEKILYYADESMSMSDGNYYEGRLGVSTLQRAFSSFTAPKQRHSTLTITLKDADLTVRELLDLYTWGNREVKVYVGKGRNLDDYSIDFHGVIKIPGGISFDRKEVFIKLRDIRNSDELMLPINKYWTTDYPNLEEKAEGKPIPIAYGDYSSMWIDVYCIDTTAKKFKIADHAIKSIENVTLNGEVGTSYSSVDLDEATFILDEDYDPDEDTVGVKFKGKVDVESNLIEKPIDILEDLLKNYVSVPDENIDQDSFDELNIETEDVRCRRYIAEELSSNTLIEELAIENMFDLFIENDKYTARSRMPKIQIDTIFNEISIMPDSMRVDSDPEGLYANRIKCNYRYDQLQDKYIRHSQEDNTIEQNRIGQVIPRTINFNWLYIDSDVHALAMHLIMLYSREINVIRFTALGDGILTKLADRVGLTFAHYQGRPLVVREISKHFNTMSCTIFGYDEVKHVLPGYITANDAPDYDDATAEERATMGFLTDDDGEAKPGDEDSKVSHVW